MKCSLELQTNLWRSRIHEEWLSFYKNLQDLKSNFKFAEQFKGMLFAGFDCLSKAPQYYTRGQRLMMSPGSVLPGAISSCTDDQYWPGLGEQQ